MRRSAIENRERTNQRGICAPVNECAVALAFAAYWKREQLGNIVWPIALGPSDVTFEVRKAADPVIQLDPSTGAVTALRLRHALVRTRFAGTESETRVVVMADTSDGAPSNCDEIREKH